MWFGLWFIQDALNRAPRAAEKPSFGFPKIRLLANTH